MKWMDCIAASMHRCSRPKGDQLTSLPAKAITTRQPSGSELGQRNASGLFIGFEQLNQLAQILVQAQQGGG